MPDTAAPPDDDQHDEHDQPDQRVVAERRCWRCLQMFPGDASREPTAREEWWVCEPCGASLFPSKRASA